MRSRAAEYPADRVPPVPRGLLAHPDPIENIRMSMPPWPIRGGQVLTNRDPDVVDAVPNLVPSHRHPFVVPEENRRLLDQAMWAANLTAGLRGARGAGANAPVSRYNTADDPLHPNARDVGPNPPAEAGPPAGSNASAFPEMDPEGRYLTAPWRAGRALVGTWQVPPRDTLGHLLDYLSRGGVTRQVPAADMPRVPNGRVLGEYSIPSSRWAGRGEETARVATTRIVQGEPRGGATEMHEAGHGIHTMQTDNARVPARALSQLGRHLSAGGKRPGTPEHRNELYAEGLALYLRDPERLHRIAPDAAALYRRHVNTDPYLSRFIQLQVVPGVLGGGAAAGLLADPPPDDDGGS